MGCENDFKQVNCDIFKAGFGCLVNNKTMQGATQEKFHSCIAAGHQK